jgi:hypothetical protein
VIGEGDDIIAFLRALPLRRAFRSGVKSKPAILLARQSLFSRFRVDLNPENMVSVALCTEGFQGV